MKIPASIRRLYAEQRRINERLAREVDGTLRPLANRNNWHYESRVKQELSVALKLESGRIKDPEAIEDFFACTLVVRNLGEIEEAEKQLRSMFTVSERRPRRTDQTHKDANAFPFDDVRLYASWSDDPALPPTGLQGVKFEIQLKTFLQHAWAIATHDLVYKTDDVSWSRQRIAYQIKAMLEHAEVSIQEADQLAGTSALSKTHKDTDEVRGIIALMKEVWEPELLPTDLRRLAENVRSAMRLADVKLPKLKADIEAEKTRQKGVLPTNISPYSAIVQALLWGEQAKMRETLKDSKRREKILVTAEMDLPEWLGPEADWVNVVRVKDADVTQV